MSNVLHIDLETYSEVDLKKCGSHVYWSHPSTKILCAAWAFNSGPIHSWDLRSNTGLFDALGQPTTPDVLNVDTEWHAWNAGGFEALARFHGRPISNWRDTMVRAAYYGLPMSLDQAAKALNLDVLKDMEGHRLMLRMCKPDKAGKVLYHDKPELLDKLVAYCKQDVETERAVSEYLPPLPDSEQKLWELDWEMMQRGMPVDLDEVARLGDHAHYALLGLNAELRRIMGGSPTINSTAQILAWVNAQLGLNSVPTVALVSLDKAAVADALANPLLPPHVRRVLEIRQEAAKSSVTKLAAMKASAGKDRRIRGLTQFYGAGRTGRWAGRLVQVQNLPRPAKGVNPDHEIGAMKITGTGSYGPPKGHTLLSTVSSCLRGLFTQPDGFVVGDFSQIEARVIAWLAGQQDVLDVFARGEDIYTYTANKLGSQDRQFGKVLVLACGFGMGAGKFQDTAATYGLTLSAVQAVDAVAAWRGANKHIVRFWKYLENSARLVLEGTSRTMVVGKITLAMGKRRLAGCLLMKLPSGRVLVYRNARLVPGEPGWPDQIAYDGVNQTTRKWETQTTYGGKLAENATQAVARDILAYALGEIDKSGAIRPLVTIHDEVVCEPIHGRGSRRTANTLHQHLTRIPPWAQGLPVAAECKFLDRYGK